jgi:D-alanyl-D-alanine dipeptidase
MEALKPGFVYLKDIAPEIQSDIKYATADNVLGRPIAGYKKNVAIITERAAHALQQASLEAKQHGYGIIVYDAYRPHKACQDIKRWSQDPHDELNKQSYYPKIPKAELFNGYFAEFSKHSRGSTVDLSLVNLTTNQPLDMGTIFDFLGEESHTDSEMVSDEASNNRQLLKGIMERAGFENYWREWWHYELRDEPFPRKPEDHFNFDVK